MHISIPFYTSILSYLVERIQVSLVGTERTLHSLGTIVAAELPGHIDRLLRKNLENLFAVMGTGEWKV